jgi:hypothetical protein
VNIVDVDLEFRNDRQYGLDDSLHDAARGHVKENLLSLE